VNVERSAGRLLIIDAAERLLMIQEALQPGQPYWLVPGGGVEGAESARDAAVREAYEETGLRLELPESAPVWLTERQSWSYGETTYDQTNQFYAVRVDAVAALTAARHTDLERETFLGFRWWHPDEIEGSGEVFYPGGVAELVRTVLRGVG
jgi:8-oxo-dGTP pyrophosphatase MutT (NUDIX family)